MSTTIKEDSHFDRSELAWKIYKLMYSQNFLFQIKDIKNECIDVKFKHNNKAVNSIKISGETDFNVSIGFAQTRMPSFKNEMKSISDEAYKKKYISYLDICEELKYSIVNISILPQTGNLQLVKQGVGNDRIDTFIWALNQYYKKQSVLLFNHCSSQNLPTLKKYLDLFGNVYDYCYEIYHIHEALVDAMIDSGKQALDSPERVIKYLTLAVRFWNQKFAYLKERLNSADSVLQEINISEQEKSEIEQMLNNVNDKIDLLFND